jgi:hypothetical protein
MSQLAQEVITAGARDFQLVKAKLGEVFGEGWKLLSRCIAKCSRQADEVLTNGSKSGDPLKVFGKKVETFLLEIKGNAISTVCAVNTLTVHLTAGVIAGVATQATLEYVSEHFFGFSIDGQEIVDQLQEESDLQELDGQRQPLRASTRASSSGRRSCNTNKLTRDASTKPNLNADYENSHAKKDPQYIKLLTDNHRLVLTAHHIVPIDLDRKPVCANNLKDVNGVMKNPCNLMKAMLRYSKIDPYVNICNIALLPDKRFFKKKAKTNGFDGVNSNPSVADWESEFRSKYPDAVDHSGLNSYAYVDAVWRLVSTGFNTVVKAEPDSKKRAAEMCVILQGVSVYLLFANPNDPRYSPAENPFAIPTFRKF